MNYKRATKKSGRVENEWVYHGTCPGGQNGTLSLIHGEPRPNFVIDGNALSRLYGHRNPISDDPVGGVSAQQFEADYFKWLSRVPGKSIKPMLDSRW